MKFNFPFKFKGFVSRDKLNEYILTRRVKFIPLRRVNLYLGAGALQSFSSIYGNVIQAMSEYDYDYLSNIMEPKLYEACKENLQDLQEKNYTLEYLEQTVHEPAASDSEDELKGVQDRKTPDQGGKFMGFNVNEGPMGEVFKGPLGFVYGEKDLQIYMEARGAFGVHIHRSKNKGIQRWLGNDTTSMTFYRKPKMSWRDIFSRQVLVLDVYYYTSRKLILKDEEGDLVDGSDNPKDLFDHKFRFESYTDKIDWVLCDIDDHLEGNPFIEEKSEEFKTEEK